LTEAAYNGNQKFTLVVQSIGVSWTKDARGFLLATPRNRVTEVANLPFSQPHPDPTAPTFIHHEISWGESNQFRQPLTEKFEITEFSGDVKNRPLGFHLAGDTLLKVRFEKSYSAKAQGNVLLNYTRLGAPARTVPLEIFSLNPGEWGQVRYNGRFSWNGGWKYEKWVYNIGVFTHTISADSFQGSPASSYSNLADLW
jgi:hypothetical protein